MSSVWILGQGGLLGSFLTTEIRQAGMNLWLPSTAMVFPWGQKNAMRSTLEHAAHAFGDALPVERAERWTIVWAAGVGVVGSPKEMLQEETETWKMLLDALTSHVLPHHPHGLIFFCSSTGGIYGGCGRGEITEATPPAPISAYGEAKLEQEQLLTTWAKQHPSISTVIGRISNLYGERQNLGKSQGLLSRLSEHMHRRIPLHIYVSLDTMRDYVYAGDCAKAIATVLSRIQCRKETEHLVKIFAAERITTIAEIIGIFTRLSKLRPRIVYGATHRTTEQPQCLRFRSIVQQDILPILRHTQLTEGILRIHGYCQKLHAQGLLSRGEKTRDTPLHQKRSPLPSRA